MTHCTVSRQALLPRRFFWREWIADFGTIALVMVGVSLVFRWTAADVEWTRRFYHAAHPARFPGESLFPWRALYRWAGVPIVLTALVCAIVILFSGHRTRWAAARRPAIAMLLALALGPGVVVNGIFKNFWGRPRPKDTVLFGGRQPFVEVWTMHAPGIGRSFPCGHSSAGYVFSMMWWLRRRRAPREGFLWLVLSLVYGTALGFARVVAGAHYPSDVALSAGLVFLVNAAIYHLFLNMPAHESLGEVLPLTWRTYLGGIVMAVAVAMGAFFALPYRRQFEHRFPCGNEGPLREVVLELEIPSVGLNVTREPALVVAGQFEGFGSFHARVESRILKGSDDLRRLRYQLQKRGWFTDLEGTAWVSLPASGLDRVELIARRVRSIAVHPSETPPAYPVNLIMGDKPQPIPPEWAVAPTSQVTGVDEARAD